MKTAEDGEQESRDYWHRNGQKYCDYPVNPNPRHLEQGMAPDPHSVTAPHWYRLSYNILKRHLKKQRETDASATEVNQ